MTFQNSSRIVVLVAALLCCLSFLIPCFTQAAAICPPGMVQGDSSSCVLSGYCSNVCYAQDSSGNPTGPQLGRVTEQDPKVNGGRSCASGATLFEEISKNYSCYDNTGKLSEIPNETPFLPKAIESATAVAAGGFGLIGKGLLAVIITVLKGVSTITIWLMQKSANLFEYSVTTFATINGFESIYSSISDAIKTVWTLIRDLSNILIIGLFVFIAINIILGIQAYGDRKLIARVLLVAVLINFSFLFTRIVITASNAFSSSLYTRLVTSTIKTNGPAGSSGSSGGSTGDKSLGHELEKLLNVLSVNSPTNAAVFSAVVNDSTVLSYAFQQAFVSVLFSLLATLLFLYGALLVISRFITLIVCLLLSSLAFATFLLPNWQEAGWSRWWSALLKNAFMAPMMMIFLWASISISQSIQAKSSGQLSQLDSSALVSFLLVLGFLWAGMYVASQLSTNLGHKFAVAMPAIGLGAASIIATRPVALGAAWRKRVSNRRLDEEKDKKNPDPKRLASLTKWSNRWDALSKKDGNVLNSGAGKLASKIPGLSSISAGQFKPAPYGKKLEDTAKKLADAYGKALPDHKQAEKIRAEASKATDSEKTQKETLSQMKRTADAAVSTAEATKRQAERAHEDNKRVLQTEQRKLSDLETVISTTRAGGGDTTQLEAERTTMIRAGSGTIARAQAAADRSTRELDEAAQRLIEAQNTHSPRSKAAEAQLTKITEKQAARGNAAVENITDSITRYATRWHPIDGNLKAAVKGKLKSHHKDHDLHDLVKKLKAADHDDHAAPAAGGGAHHA